MDLEDFLYDLSCDYGYDYDKMCRRYLKGERVRSECCSITAKGTLCKITCNGGEMHCHIHGGSKAINDMFVVNVTLEGLIDKICRIHRLDRSALRKRYVCKIIDREDDPNVINDDEEDPFDYEWVLAEEARLSEFD